MSLVKYINDNIPETDIGFLTDDILLRDYLINVIPVIFSTKSEKKVFEYQPQGLDYQPQGENKFTILITDTQNETLIKTLIRNFSLLIYRDKNITFIPKNENQEIELKGVDDILDLFEGEVFYNIFMGFKKDY
jgi:hypothetical protein